MENMSSSRNDSQQAHSSTLRHTRAWFFLVAALALHVLDEALNDFLGFYNPLVENIRERISWFPMPTFTLDIWLGGLISLVVVLALLGFWIYRGSAGIYFISQVFGVIMILNGLGHLAASIYFQRWLPGATSSPLLLPAGFLLLFRARQRKQHEVVK